MAQLQFLRDVYEMPDRNLPFLPRSPQIGGKTQLPVLPNPTTDQRDPDGWKGKYSFSTRNGGIEVVNSRVGNMSINEVEELKQRQQGMQRTKDIIYEQIADYQCPVEESELIVRCLEKRADGRVRQTYYDGKRVNDISEAAAIPKIGVTFMPGVDTPQANRLEQVGMTSNVPDQKTAIWRVNTAGTLLNDFEVDKDLSIVQSDNTAQVVAKSRARNPFVEKTYFASKECQAGTGSKTLRGEGCDDQQRSCQDCERPGSWQLGS
jgi:hypothetical protein